MGEPRGARDLVGGPAHEKHNQTMVPAKDSIVGGESSIVGGAEAPRR